MRYALWTLFMSHVLLSGGLTSLSLLTEGNLWLQRMQVFMLSISANQPLEPIANGQAQFVVGHKEHSHA